MVFLIHVLSSLSPSDDSLEPIYRVLLPIQELKNRIAAGSLAHPVQPLAGGQYVDSGRGDLDVQTQSSHSTQQTAGHTGLRLHLHFSGSLMIPA